jgi:hypothetical protein
MGDSAVRTIPRAHVTKHHECRRAMLPAFTYVGAMRLLANSMEIELAHEVLQATVIGTPRGPDLEPRGLPLWERGRPVAAEDLVECIRQEVPESEVAFSPSSRGRGGLSRYSHRRTGNLSSWGWLW